MYSTHFDCHGLHLQEVLTSRSIGNVNFTLPRDKSEGLTLCDDYRTITRYDLTGNFGEGYFSAFEVTTNFRHPPYHPQLQQIKPCPMHNPRGGATANWPMIELLSSMFS